ncbi:MAG: hypothetical protein ACI9X4_000311 [Glaciecola sp.]
MDAKEETPTDSNRYANKKERGQVLRGQKSSFEVARQGDKSGCSCFRGANAQHVPMTAVCNIWARYPLSLSIKWTAVGGVKLNPRTLPQTRTPLAQNQQLWRLAQILDRISTALLITDFVVVSANEIRSPARAC